MVRMDEISVTKWLYSRPNTPPHSICCMSSCNENLNILHVLMQPKDKNPCVNQSIKNMFILAHEMDRTNECFLN